jgi:uncharacterized membrane protein
MTDDLNPYAPPSVDADLVPGGNSQGSLEDALAGRWDFQIGELLSESWRLTSGYKGTFWLTAIIGIVLMIISQLVTTAFTGALGVASPLLAMIVGIPVTVAFAGISYPAMYLPIFMTALDKFDGRPVSMKTMLDYKPSVVPMIIVGVLVTLLVSLGMVLLLIPGLYLSSVYMTVTPLVCERNLKPWEAMETSRKSCTHHWGKILLLMLAIGLVGGIGGVITLGIGFIWLAPWMAMTYAVLFRRIFGPRPA